MVWNLLLSLGLTLILEIVASYLSGVRLRRDIGVVIWTNICTNPLVVYIANLILLSIMPYLLA